jgi:hypothetical protein
VAPGVNTTVTCTATGPTLQFGSLVNSSALLCLQQCGAYSCPLSYETNSSVPGNTTCNRDAGNDCRDKCCKPASCLVPVTYTTIFGPNAANGTCIPGTLLQNGESCTVQCKAGYLKTNPTGGTYVCSFGSAATPPNPSCQLLCFTYHPNCTGMLSLRSVHTLVSRKRILFHRRPIHAFVPRASGDLAIMRVSHPRCNQSCAHRRYPGAQPNGRLGDSVQRDNGGLQRAVLRRQAKPAVQHAVHGEQPCVRPDPCA